MIMKNKNMSPRLAGKAVILIGIASVSCALEFKSNAEIVGGLTNKSVDAVNDARLAGASYGEQAAAAGHHPAPGHGHRLIGEHGAVVHQALAQAHALAVLEVDRGNNQHRPFHSRKLRNSRNPAVWLFSG